MTGWAVLSPGGPAHEVQPAGGEGTHRTGCGRIAVGAPVPAGDDVRRCARCVARLGGFTGTKPVIEKKTGANR